MTGTRPCTIEGCDNELQSRGWCQTHYSRWRIHGDPLKSKFKAKSFEEAFEHYTEWQGECLVWVGYCNSDGYGKVSYEGKYTSAHRAIWRHNRGAIPRGLEIDHECHTRNCVNLNHLRLATRQEQMSNLSGAYKSNTTGYRGVTRRGDKFIARTQHENSRVYLGKFDTPEEANQAIESYKESN